MKNKLQFSFRFLLLFLLLSGITSFGQPFGQAPEERTSNYDVQHIKIEVRLDLEKKTVDGKVITSIISKDDPLTSFKVDAAGMNIKDVKGWALTQTDKPDQSEQFENIKYEYDNKELTIHPFGNVAKGFPYKYEVNYSVTDPEKGLYFIQPSADFPNKRYEVWSQGEGEDNRYWFPCYDYPNDKATTEMYITVDKKYQTLSNGQMTDSHENSDGTITWHWVLNNRHSSYLVMLAAGNWDIIEGQYLDIPVYSYVPPGKKDIAMKSFDFTPDVIKFFSEFTGYKYAWDNFKQVVVQEFIYGGMENTSAVVLTDASVYDDKTPPDYTATGLVAHELAHQWWGDVVTCKNWNEIWLNESFATYFDALYTEYKFGKDEFDYQIMKNGDGAISADSTTARKPIYNREGLTVNTYSKGSVVLNMLRNQVGTEKFRKALNRYITANQFQNVTTTNLLDAFNSEMTIPGSEQGPPDYKWFFDEWIYRAGQPEYKVSYEYNDNNKVLSIAAQQVQRMDTSSVFRTPVPVEIITSGSDQTVYISPDDESRTFMYNLDSKPLCVVFNKGNAVLSKVYFTKPMSDWLFQLKNSTNAIDRITAIKGLKAFIGEREILKELINAIREDKFWGVKNEGIFYLRYSKEKRIASDLMNYYSLEKDSRIRRTILGTLAYIKKNCPDCIGSGILSKWLLNKINSEKSYYAIAEGIGALSQIIPKDKIYDIVYPFINMDSHNEIIRRYVLDALKTSEDKRAFEAFVLYANSGGTSRVRNLAISGLANFIKDERTINLLNQKLSDHNRGTQYAVLGLLEKAKNSSSLPYMQAAYDKTNDEGFKKRIKEVMDKIK